MSIHNKFIPAPKPASEYVVDDESIKLTTKLTKTREQYDVSRGKIKAMLTVARENRAALVNSGLEVADLTVGIDILTRARRKSPQSVVLLKRRIGVQEKNIARLESLRSHKQLGALYHTARKERRVLRESMNKLQQQLDALVPTTYAALMETIRADSRVESVELFINRDDNRARPVLRIALFMDSVTNIKHGRSDEPKSHPQINGGQPLRPVKLVQPYIYVTLAGANCWVAPPPDVRIPYAHLAYSLSSVYPHIMGDSTPCWGGFSSGWATACSNKDMVSVVNILFMYLNTVDLTDGAGGSLTRIMTMNLASQGASENEITALRSALVSSGDRGSINPRFKYEQDENGYFVRTAEPPKPIELTDIPQPLKELLGIVDVPQEAAPESTTVAATERIPEPAPEPTLEPAPEPTLEPAPEPVPDAIADFMARHSNPEGV